MMKKLTSASLIVSSLLFTACATAPNQPTTTAAIDQLSHKTWIVTHIGNVSITSQPDVPNIPSLQFDGKNRFSGSDGCNRIMGSYTASNSILRLSDTASTMMACLATNSDQVSKSYTEALTKVSSYQVTPQTLILKDATGTAVLQFTSPVQPR